MTTSNIIDSTIANLLTGLNNLRRENAAEAGIQTPEFGYTSSLEALVDLRHNLADGRVSSALGALASKQEDLVLGGALMAAGGAIYALEAWTQAPFAEVDAFAADVAAEGIGHVLAFANLPEAKAALHNYRSEELRRAKGAIVKLQQMLEQDLRAA